jgi:hypothetical protein
VRVHNTNALSADAVPTEARRSARQPATLSEQAASWRVPHEPDQRLDLFATPLRPSVSRVYRAAAAGRGASASLIGAKATQVRWRTTPKRA